MRGRGARRAVRVMLPVMLGLVLMVAGVGCGGPSGGSDALPVPTFPPAAAGSGPDGAGARADEGAVPDDCSRLLPVSDLEAVLGLPLGSVAVRSTIHVPAPAVGRTERIACRYTRTGGAQLLAVDVSAYVDAAAAESQWQVNAEAEQGEPRELSIGSARAAFVQRPSETVLMVVNAASTITLLLPDGVRVGDRPGEDTLVDLALRVLPAIASQAAAGTAPSSPAAVVPTGAPPAVAARVSS